MFEKIEYKTSVNLRSEKYASNFTLDESDVRRDWLLVNMRV